MMGSENSGSSDEDKPLAVIKKKVNKKRIRNDSLENKKDDKDVDVQSSSSKKRTGLDLFDFDEYDEFDTKTVKCGHFEDGVEAVLGEKGNGKAKKLGVSSNKKSKLDKRKESVDIDGSRSRKSKGKDSDDMTNKGLELEGGDEPIRLQGKNGLLKVRMDQKIKKRKKKGMPSSGKSYDSEEVKEHTDSESDDIVRKDSSYESPNSMRRKDERDTSTEKVKKGKSKNVGSTEKQMLREKIKEMLMEAGWTIDYRPRKNRDYQDAVYMDPRGIGYWSITKAYDAFKKQLEEDDDESKPSVGSTPVNPLPEDLVNKLTRRTKKKIQAEMRTKNRHDPMIKTAEMSPQAESSENSDSEEEPLSFFMKQKNKTQRDQSRGVDRETGDDPCNISENGKPSKLKVEEKAYNTTKPNITRGGTNALTASRCTLVVRNSNKGEDFQSDGYIPYSGKRTILAWVIDSGTAKPGERLKYMNRKRSRVMQEGWITRDGIHCGCCSKILTVSKFEVHAGSKSRQPFENIFLESGPSLLQCQIDAWNKQDESTVRGFHNIVADGDVPDDDTCGICGDGGDLMCCDSCTSTFHHMCLGMKTLPSDDWHCPHCTCKFCGKFDASDDVNDLELSRCSFCVKKYHASCSKKVSEKPMSATFCELTCQKLYDHFQKIIGVKHELEVGYSWSLLQRTGVSDTSVQEFTNRVECNSKLAVALSVMDECFLPIIDRRGGINIIKSVVYNCGSNFNRLDFGRFYTAVLERGDEIVCAASIRIHGTVLAEIPFIGTREKYRRQGMCLRFLSAIESELRSVKVAQLIVPAIAEHTSTWMDGFGFRELGDAHRRELKSLNLLVFPDTDMLQKQLAEPKSPEAAKEDSEATKEESHSPVSVEETDIEAAKIDGEPSDPENLSAKEDGASKMAVQNVQKESPLSSPGLIPSPSVHGETHDNASSENASCRVKEADKCHTEGNGTKSEVEEDD